MVDKGGRFTPRASLRAKSIFPPATVAKTKKMPIEESVVIGPAEMQTVSLAIAGNSNLPQCWCAVGVGRCMFLETRFARYSHQLSVRHELQAQALQAAGRQTRCRTTWCCKRGVYMCVFVCVCVFMCVCVCVRLRLFALVLQPAKRRVFARKYAKSADAMHVHLLSPYTPLNFCSGGDGKSVDQVIDEIGFGRYQGVLCLCTCACAMPLSLLSLLFPKLCSHNKRV